MAKINIILQGFVDLNLETDENINTKIGSINQSQTIQLNADVGKLLKSKSLTLPSVLELPVPAEDIFENINLDINSVQTMHIQGSRLYGVESVESDWDISIVSTDIEGFEFTEANVDGYEFDIKLYSQEALQDSIDLQKMREIEFVNHPSNVILIENKTFTHNLDVDKLISQAKYESDDLWERGRVVLETGSRDPYIAHKNFWHSFRFLIFAEQILENGSIVDFTAANYLYESFINSKQTDYSYFNTTFSQLREAMKLKLNTYLEDDGLQSIEFKL